MIDKRDGTKHQPVPSKDQYFPQSGRHQDGKASSDTGFGTDKGKRGK